MSIALLSLLLTACDGTGAQPPCGCTNAFGVDEGFEIYMGGHPEWNYDEMVLRAVGDESIELVYTTDGKTFRAIWAQIH